MHRTHDTGRRIIRNGVEWPILHHIDESAWGWCITREHCAGDMSTAEREYFDARSEAFEAWHNLTGETLEVLS